MDDRQLSPSPTRSLRGRLKQHSTGLSLLSTSSNGDGDSEKSKMRTRVDNALDKIKDRTRAGSIDAGDARRDSQDSGGRRLSKLISVRSKRKKRDSYTAPATDDMDAFGSSGIGQLLDVSASTVNPASQESLHSPKNRSGGSSLLTEDSDGDSSPNRRSPILSSQPSHAQYLTLSSPLIVAETVHTTDTDSPIQPPPDLDKPDDNDDNRVESPLSLVRKPVATSKVRSIPPLTPKSSRPSSGVVDIDPVKTGGGIASGITGGLAGVFGSGKKSARKNSQSSLDQSTSPGNARLTLLSKGMTVARTDTATSPTTVVTPPTPTDASPKTPSRKADLQIRLPPSLHKSSLSSSTIISPLPSTSLSHRRARSSSNAPGKLSNTIDPLTPAVEEVKTPGGSLISPSLSGGFFSSVVSVTQNAVNSLSTTFGTTSSPPFLKNKGGNIVDATDRSLASKEDNSDALEVTKQSTDDSSEGKKELAIATLGSGDLSLDLLGISESSADPSPMASKADLSDDANRSRSTTQTTAFPAYEDGLAAQPRKDPSPDQFDAGKLPVISDRISSGSRPSSIAVAMSGTPGDQTPPRSAQPEPEPTGLLRSGSVRSRISRRKRRVRGSSRESGNTIAAAIGGTHAVTAMAAGSGPAGLALRPAGYAVASSKRNRDFHALFRSVPENDYLIEDYSAALQRDILLHGRLYVSEQHICFSSNILGWVTNLVVGFDEIIAMEKKTTAVIFPNAIVIQTLHARNVFASLISRDSTYDLLIGIWKIGHPNLKATLTGHTLDGSAPIDKKEGDSGDSDFSDQESDFTDDDDDDGRASGSYRESGSSVAGSEVVDLGKASPIKTTSTNGATIKQVDISAPTGNGSTTPDFPGPAAHAPTECTDQDTHYDKQLVDTTIPAPLGKVYSMMFGPTSGVVMRKFLLDDQKSGDLQMEDDKKGLGEENKTFSYSFIKPLGAAIGPKQTKCIVNQTMDFFDLTKAVSVTCSTQTPDVPSGNIFLTKTKYCLMWGPSNSTRLVMNCTIEWQGKSWLRVPIEKGANEGQVQYGKDLVAFFKAAVATKSSSKAAAATKGKRKRSKTTRSASDKSITNTKGQGNSSTSQRTDGWGTFSPLQGVLEPLGSILGPAMSLNGLLTILLLVVTSLWIRSPSASVTQSSRHAGRLSAAERAATYEDLWRYEESELWDWMEERLDLDRISKASRPRSRHEGPDGARASGHVDMTAREIDEAIRITEQRLEAFKLSVQRDRRRESRP